MSTLFYLSPEQITRFKPYFPLSHGVPSCGDCGYPEGFQFRRGDAQLRSSPIATLKTPHEFESKVRLELTG